MNIKQARNDLWPKCHPPTVMAPLTVAVALCMHAAGVQPQTIPRVRAAPPEALKAASSPGATPPTVTLTADDVVSHIGNVTQASGKVQVKRIDMNLRADLLTYDQLSDTVYAQGNVQIERGLDWFRADRADLELTRDAGTLTGSEYELGARRAGGHAQRIELIDRNRSMAYNANYTSCNRDGTGDPDWILSGDQIDIDTTTNEGKAKHAVLRFLGVPIFAVPSMTFPVTAERKSGWLPPTAEQSSHSGVGVSAPYYWDIAPNLDATLSAGYLIKSGAIFTGELRYLQPNDLGQVTAYALPDDEVYGKGRGAIEWAHEGSRSDGLAYSARVQRVSDSSYWKDFTGQMPALTPRLLPTDLSGSRRLMSFGDTGEIDSYARVERFQALQDPGESDGSSLIAVPYQRSPQLGLRGNMTLKNQLHFEFEAEGDRFDLADRSQENGYANFSNCANYDSFNGLAQGTNVDPATCLKYLQDNKEAYVPIDQRVGGVRAHVIGTVSRSFASDWWRIEPRLSIHGVTYRSDEGAGPGAAGLTPPFGYPPSARTARSASSGRRSCSDAT